MAGLWRDPGLSCSCNGDGYLAVHWPLFRLRMMRGLVTLVAAAVLAVGGSSAEATELRPKARPLPTAAASPVAAASAVAREVYAARGMAPLWTGSSEAQARRRAMLALLARERQADPSVPDPEGLEAAFGRKGKEAQLDAELRLTEATLAYLARRRGGGEVPTARAVRALERLEAAGATPLALALTELEIVDALGGWRDVGTIPGPLPLAEPLRLVSPEIDVAPAFPPRKRLPDPVPLRQRLVQSGDLSAADLLPGPELPGGELDETVTAAVKRFQKRHGLVPDGVVGPRTLAAMNDSVRRQMAQVRLNMARPQPDRSKLARYVEVNVPSYELRLVDRGRVVLRSAVIVGEKDNPTPIFDDHIRYIEINPFWYVPKSIVPELLEKEARKPGYLSEGGFIWRASVEGGPADRLIQRPGPENALGRLKFMFPNHHSVYLHDTAQRSLFGRSQRSLSHGCVRVEKPIELALALLGDQGWDAARLDQAFATAKTRRVDLAVPVPVFLDYRTAFVDDAGRLNLWPDLYGHDAAGITVFKEKGLRPVQAPAPERLPEPIVVRSTSQAQATPVATTPTTAASGAPATY